MNTKTATTMMATLALLATSASSVTLYDDFTTYNASTFEYSDHAHGTTDGCKVYYLKNHSLVNSTLSLHEGRGLRMVMSSSPCKLHPEPCKGAKMTADHLQSVSPNLYGDYELRMRAPYKVGTTSFSNPGVYAYFTAGYVNHDGKWNEMNFGFHPDRDHNGTSVSCEHHGDTGKYHETNAHLGFNVRESFNTFVIRLTPTGISWLVSHNNGPLSEVHAAKATLTEPMTTRLIMRTNFRDGDPGFMDDHMFEISHFRFTSAEPSRDAVGPGVVGGDADAVAPGVVRDQAWPNICTHNSTGLESCWPTCQVRCPADAVCCKVRYSVQGVGCCPSGPNPDREPGCKAGPPLPMDKTKKNIVIMGDSVSMGYTPWVAKALGTDTHLVQHSVWGDGVPGVCNTTSDPPCDPDPSGTYTGDGGDEETAYGRRCLGYMLAHPDGTAIQADLIMFNWGLHDGPLGNRTRPGQQGNSSVYAPQLQEIATKLKTYCATHGCKLLYAMTSAMLCDVKANDNVSSLNRQAAAIMASLGIATVDLQEAIVSKCGPVPQESCFNIKRCFCPHCPNSLARPSPGYDWLAASTIAPKIKELLSK